MSTKQPVGKYYMYSYKADNLYILNNLSMQDRMSVLRIKDKIYKRMKMYRYITDFITIFVSYPVFFTIYGLRGWGEGG